MAGTFPRFRGAIGRLDKADMDEWWTGYSVAVMAVAGSWFTALAAGAAAWAGISLAFGRFRFDLHRQSLPLVVSCTALAIWAMATGAWHDGLAGLGEGTLFALPLLALPLLISRFRASDPQRSWRALSGYALVGMALAAGLAIAQRLMGQIVEGGAGNAYVFGFLCVTLAILASAGEVARQRARLVLYLFLALLVQLALYLADARIHFMYMALFLLAFASLTIRDARRRFFFLAAASAAVAAASWPVVSGMMREVMQGTGYGPATSLGLRLEMWRAAFLKIAEVPVLGTGFLSKMQEVRILMPEHAAYLQFTHLHNIFIDAAVSMGIPGMVLVAFIMVSAWHMMAGLDSGKRFAGRAFIALCLVHGSLGPIFTHDIAASAFIVVLAVFAGCLGREAGHRA